MWLFRADSEAGSRGADRDAARLQKPCPFLAANGARDPSPLRIHRLKRTGLIQHCLRNICANDSESEISKESSRSTSAAAEVKRARGVAVTLNQYRQVAKREIVRSRKLKRRICPSSFLIFVHVSERAIHRISFGWRAEGQADSRTVCGLTKRQRKNCDTTILGPDPKIGSSGDRSWPGTAGRFPMVPACSTASGIRHDRLGRSRGLFAFGSRMRSAQQQMRRAKRERRLFGV